MDAKLFVAGAATALAGRSLVARALLLKFSRDLRKLNAGDHEALLSSYADDAVLRFSVGDHRFSGDWRGKAEIERFPRNFAAAGLQGEITGMAMSGPPWAMTVFASFDDRSVAPDGEELYANHSAIVLQTRWGKVTLHEDFWVDTAPIADFEAKLVARGIAAVPKEG